MSRAKVAVVGIAAVVLLAFAGLVVVMNQSDESGGPDVNRGGPGGGEPHVNAKIVGLDVAVEEQREDVGTAPRPVRLSPAGSVSVAAAESARVGGVAPVASPPVCSASLLQSILGLGVTLLGGPAGC